MMLSSSLSKNSTSLSQVTTRRREVELWNVITSVNPYLEIVRLGGGAAQLQSVEEHSFGAAPVGRKNWRTAGRTGEAPEELEDRRSREEELWNAG
ncbi:hypothetical protein LXL04_002049 [Taraxacum kok-saghyz]